MIEKYIEFAIANWFNEFRDFRDLQMTRICRENVWFFWEHLYWWWEQSFYINLIEIITSKLFIEAIARWLEKNKIDLEKLYISNILLDECIFLETWYKYISDLISILQSIAIRDWKLDDFIKNILILI